MFVISIKPTSKKSIVIVSAIIVALATLIMIIIVATGKPARVTPSGIDLYVPDSQARLSFFRQYGWEVCTDPFEIVEVIIPNEFSSVYNEYNEIQKAQEMDLSDYKGERVTKWTYALNNYPDDKEDVYATILVHDDIVVGGGIFTKEENPLQISFLR